MVRGVKALRGFCTVAIVTALVGACQDSKEPLRRSPASFVLLPVEITNRTSVRAFLFNFDLNDPNQFEVAADAGRGLPNPLTSSSFVFAPQDGRENAQRGEVHFSVEGAASLTVDRFNSTGRLVSNPLTITGTGEVLTTPPRLPDLVVAQSGPDTVLWVFGEDVTSVELTEGEGFEGRLPARLDAGSYSCNKNVLPWLEPLLTACNLAVVGVLSPGYAGHSVRALVQTSTGPVLTAPAKVR